MKEKKDQVVGETMAKGTPLTIEWKFGDSLSEGVILR